MTSRVLLALAAVAWAGSAAYAQHIGNGSGTMGVGFGEFLAMWAAMMAAMMLPALAPVASTFARTIATSRTARLSLFEAGYLLAWAAVGIPAYAALRVVDHVGVSDSIMRNIAVGILIAAGLYQLTPQKARYLRHCRSFVGLSQTDNPNAGSLRDLKLGVQHGGSCLACSWALMALFIAFGVMNLWAMPALAAVVVAEKLLPRGVVIARCAGAACMLIGMLVLASHSVAAALVPSARSM